MKIALTAIATLLACAAFNVAAQHKPEDVIRYRQGAMSMISWNFGPLWAMVRGKIAWDAREFALHADRLAQLAPQVPEGFAKGSDKGAETDAKPEIWANPEDFQSKASDFANEAKALSDVAKDGDEAKMKEQFKKLAGTCKGCHDKYKAD